MIQFAESGKQTSSRHDISSLDTEYFFPRCIVYRDRLKGLKVVARSLFLLLLTCSAWPCLGPA